VIELVFSTVALTAAGWAVWVRRKCWTIPWERTTTSAIVQLMLALVLIAPAAEPCIGRLLWEITGRWHVDDYLGHMLELGAFVSSNIAGMMRLPAMRRYIAPLLWTPLVLGTAVLMQLFWRTSASDDPSPDLFQLPQHHWLTAYFVVLWLLLGYYGAINGWCALAHLRHDPRARPVALTWLACLGIATASMLGLLVPALLVPNWYAYARVGMCVAVALFAVSSARSWQRKLQQWHGLIKVTGARL
jgi:hypothetical protein